MDTERKSITLEEETIREVEYLAKKEGRSFSNMVERILRQHLERIEK